MDNDLFVLGEIPKNFVGLAVVGSRQMSKRGQKLAYDFSFFLAQKGLVIVSGLARGIDTVAHQAALDAGGKTIAVIGSGIDVIYPPENKDLAQEIARHGAVISPYPKGTPPNRENFKPRNGLIVELSSGVLVVEGQRRSGTINTANWAGDKGKEVFAIPGSPATDYLIDSGATPITSPVEILECLNLTS